MAKKSEDTTECPPERIGLFYLDSGAFSLHTKLKKEHKSGNKNFSPCDSPEFWEYADRYAAFIKKYPHAIDFYANIDIISNPKQTWKVQRYLEKKHGLRPVPVVHYGESLDWLQRYMDNGYDLIGIGGLAGRHLVSRKDTLAWLDNLFHKVCPKSNGRNPIVRLHGFAVTAYDLLIRYPWWSVDSASWTKAGGFGSLYVPRVKRGVFTFYYVDKEGMRQPIFPYNISASAKSPARKEKERSILTMSHPDSEVGADKVVERWLEQIGVPLGSVDDDGEMIEWGVVSHHAARKIANLKFFEAMCNSLPEWPWAFKGSPMPKLLESL